MPGRRPAAQRFSLCRRCPRTCPTPGQRRSVKDGPHPVRPRPSPLRHSPFSSQTCPSSCWGRSCDRRHPVRPVKNTNFFKTFLFTYGVFRTSRSHWPLMSSSSGCSVMYRPSNSSFLASSFSRLKITSGIYHQTISGPNPTLFSHM